MNAADVIEQLRTTGELTGVALSDPVVLTQVEVEYNIDCTDCKFEEFSSPCIVFQKPVRFTNCTFQRCCFYAAFFLRGLAIARCTFQTPVTFQSGGHNSMECDFAITDTVFDAFVDFEDCWFTGPVLIMNVEFRAGTNLLGNKETPMDVSFDVPPAILNTRGLLDVNTYKAP